MVKKDGFKDVWCENRSICKCMSRKRIWNDKTIPTTEYKHSNACRLRKNRETQANRANRANQAGKNEQSLHLNKDSEVEVTVRNNHMVSKTTKKKDFKLGYIDPTKKDALDESHPGNSFLKVYEDMAERQLLNEDITVSKVIQFNTKLEEFGMQIVLEEMIRIIRKREKDDLIALYREAFIEFDSNDVMMSWVINLKSLGIYNYNELIGAATIKKFEIEKQSCYQVLLLGVWKKHKKKGNGKKLMKNLMEKCDNIVLWSDKQSVEFYKKLGFEESEDIQRLTKDFVTLETNSVFLYWGFRYFVEEKGDGLSWNSSDEAYMI
jgi:GNAT superfamily N-acetyltransferase